jgi:hypothetical protein
MPLLPPAAAAAWLAAGEALACSIYWRLETGVCWAAQQAPLPAAHAAMLAAGIAAAGPARGCRRQHAISRTKTCEKNQFLLLL